jgi:hypothetical protein
MPATQYPYAVCGQLLSHTIAKSAIRDAWSMHNLEELGHALPTPGCSTVICN